MKYLIYAVGEIFLVVIGILIALQINNWNEANKEIKIGKNYLERIKIDLVKDTLNLSRKINFAKVEQKAYEEYIRELYKEQSNIEEFTKLISSVGWNADNLIIENKTYVEITNSGRLSYINDEEVRNSIMNYYKKYTEFDKHISEMNQTGIGLMQDIYKAFVKYYNSIRPLFNKENIVEVHDWKYINEPSSAEFKELESASVYYYFKQTVFERYYKELNTDAIFLIDKIENILKN